MSDITFTKDQVMKLCAEAHLKGQQDGVRMVCNNLIDQMFPMYRDKMVSEIEELIKVQFSEDDEKPPKTADFI